MNLSSLAFLSTLLASAAAQWQACPGSTTFAVNSITPLTIGGGNPINVALQGWYTATVNQGATLTVSTTVCTGGGSANTCLAPISQTKSFNFCTLQGVLCPVASAWFMQNMNFLIPGIVTQSGVPGSATVRITGADGALVMCLSNAYLMFTA
ncbi:hypothetical protein HDU98_009598 [Podochytrium sp. JEL0797]|nr:hypothetical protein HDU98_009598 [Podochytrium sp. JEL0797]